MNLDHLTKEQRDDAEIIQKALNYSIACPELTKALDRLVSAIPRHEPTGKELVGKLAMVRDRDTDSWYGPVKIYEYNAIGAYPAYISPGSDWYFARALTTEEREAALKALE